MIAGAAATLDRASALPLYRQIERILRAELASGEGAPAHRLTESQLMSRFRVSRHTVRQALSRLSAAGLLERHPRRGTYARQGFPVEQPLSGVYSFVRSLQDAGLPYHVRILSQRRVRSSAAMRDQLGAADLVELQRVHELAGEPLVAETIWLPSQRLPGIRRLDLSGSIYELLQERYGLRVTSAREQLRPVLLNAAQSRLLDTKPGGAAFLVERLSLLDDEAIEVRHSLIRGDRWLYSVQLNASPDELSA